MDLSLIDAITQMSFISVPVADLLPLLLYFWSIAAVTRAMKWFSASSSMTSNGNDVRAALLASPLGGSKHVYPDINMIPSFGLDIYTFLPTRIGALSHIHFSN